MYDAVVVGAGQSGLAAAWALRTRGLDPVALEARAEPGGSWPDYYDSLTLFSPARYSGLPGSRFPGAPQHYPRRDEVTDYLRSYAKSLDVELRVNHPVASVHADDESFIVRTKDGSEVRARLVIAATGGFGRPHRPALPGLESFTGRVLHSSEYREPDGFAGQRVVVVGAGNSAVQIAVEVAEVGRVSLATRKPVKYVPQRSLGRDMHFWFAATGIDTAPIGPWLRRTPTAPVFDAGQYRTAVASGRPDRRAMFVAAHGDEVEWADRAREKVDTIILATGYQPDLDYLSALGALDERGHPLHRRGISTARPGLGFVGLEWQRSLSSASLRGVGRDADYVARRLIRQTSTQLSSGRERSARM